MKRRKNLIIAFLLVASLVLGLGYAAVTDVLDINGTADVNQSAAEQAFDVDVYFSSAVANRYQEGVEKKDVASIVDTDNDMASFTAFNLKGQDDYATFTFTIKNDGDLDAVVTPTLAADGNTNPAYFSIVSDWVGQPKELKAGESVDYTVTVTLLKTPTETIHGSFHIELTATAGEAVVDETPGE